MTPRDTPHSHQRGRDPGGVGEALDPGAAIDAESR